MTKKIEKIDYAAEFAKTAKMLEGDKLNAIVLAPSGGGKSTLAGTFGVRTLYLYGSSENHGPKSARAFSNCEVVPVCIDLDRSPDQALDFLLSILNDKEVLKDFDAIALDSSNSMELIIRETERFKIGCMSAQGKHNVFAEGTVALSIFNEILTAMRNSGKHTIMTCILDVKEIDPETNEILDSAPRISTYSLAENIILQHGDIFTIGRLVQGDKEGHRIQFTSRMSKTAKDAVGRIKRTQNYTPRLAGYAGKLPGSLPADLSKLIEFKAKGGK